MLIIANKLKCCIKNATLKAAKPWSLPYCHEIFNNFKNEEATIIPRKYPKCAEGSMKYRQGCKIYQYSKKNYRKEMPICKRAFFEKSKVSIDLLLKIVYF